MSRFLGLGLSCLILLANPGVAETLRYKFKEGEKLDYVLNNDIKMKMDFNGAAMEMAFNMIFDLVWNVKAVDPDGTATIVQKTSRVQLKVDSPFGEMAYDTATPGSELEGPMADMGKILKAIEAGEFTLKVSPAGKVTDVQFPKQLTEVLGEQGGQRRGGPGRGGMGLFTPDSIKLIIERSFVPLPEGELKEGVTWKQKFTQPVMRAGKQHFEIDYSYGGMKKEQDKDVALINGTTKVTFEPAEEGGDIDAEINEQKGAGVVLFDPAAGQLQSSKHDQHILMTIQARDNEIQQDMNSTTTMKRGKSDNPPLKVEKKEGKQVSPALKALLKGASKKAGKRAEPKD